MQQDVKEIILEILNIIGFEDDKRACADEFIQNSKAKALLDLLTALPKEKQEQFKSQIAGVTDLHQQQTIIASYVTPEQYQEALQKASTTAFQGLLEAVIPTLSNDQADKLRSYLQSLSSLAPTVHS